MVPSGSDAMPLSSKLSEDNKTHWSEPAQTFGGWLECVSWFFLQLKNNNTKQQTEITSFKFCFFMTEIEVREKRDF